jgi:hypothetical protein
MSARRWVLTAAVLGAAALGCSSLFAPGRPAGFDGWFHIDRGIDRATSIRFDDGAIFRFRDYGCTNQDVLDTDWVDSGNGALVVPSLAGPPRFTSDGQGNLIASPGLFTFDGGVETWAPGARCFLCSADGGVYACDNPTVQDGGP